MTSSPFLTLMGARSPLSRRLPSPTLRTLPRLGFSLAVSGRTMPDLVFDSASTRLTRILSRRGRGCPLVYPSQKKFLSLFQSRLGDEPALLFLSFIRGPPRLVVA